MFHVPGFIDGQKKKKHSLSLHLKIFQISQILEFLYTVRSNDDGERIARQAV